MNGKNVAYHAAVLVALFSCVAVGRCYGQKDPLQVEVQGFSCTNEPISHAIPILGKRSPVPIDVIVDDVTDSVVTVSMERGSIGQILNEMLASRRDLRLHEESGAILIGPDWLFDKQVHPLTRKLSVFSITCWAGQMRGGTTYAYVFDSPENPPLNIGLSPMRLNQKPDYPSFPHIRTFQNQSIVEILVTLSRETKQSFYCYRLSPSYVKQRNKEIADQKMGPTWWPKPDDPCYSVFWGTDWSGIRPRE